MRMGLILSAPEKFTNVTRLSAMPDGPTRIWQGFGHEAFALSFASVSPSRRLGPCRLDPCRVGSFAAARMGRALQESKAGDAGRRHSGAACADVDYRETPARRGDVDCRERPARPGDVVCRGPPPPPPPPLRVAVMLFAGSRLHVAVMLFAGSRLRVSVMLFAGSRLHVAVMLLAGSCLRIAVMLFAGSRLRVAVMLFAGSRLRIAVMLFASAAARLAAPFRDRVFLIFGCLSLRSRAMMRRRCRAMMRRRRRALVRRGNGPADHLLDTRRDRRAPRHRRARSPYPMRRRARYGRSGAHSSRPRSAGRVHHMADAIHIDAARRDVGRDEHADGTAAKSDERALPGRLRLVAVDRLGLDLTRFAARSAIRLAPCLVRAKTRARSTVGSRKRFASTADFSARSRANDALAHALHRRRRGVTSTSHRLPQDRGGEPAMPPASSPRRTTSAALRHCAHDPLPNVVQEAHVEHAVGLSSTRCSTSPSRSALLATRSSRRPGVATSTSTPLSRSAPARTHRDAADGERRADADMAAVRPEAIEDLARQLTRWAEHLERGSSCVPGGACLSEEVMQDRERERRRLARAGLGNADDVAAGQRDRRWFESGWQSG